MPLARDEFTCDVCRGTFSKSRSDEDAAAEADAAFSPDELEAAGVVCEDCWQKMRGAMPSLDDRYES